MPSRRLCTPAVTICSPGASPFSTAKSAPWRAPVSIVRRPTRPLSGSTTQTVGVPSAAATIAAIGISTVAAPSAVPASAAPTREAAVCGSTSTAMPGSTRRSGGGVRRVSARSFCAAAKREPAASMAVRLRSTSARATAWLFSQSWRTRSYSAVAASRSARATSSAVW